MINYDQRQNQRIKQNEIPRIIAAIMKNIILVIRSLPKLSNNGITAEYYFLLFIKK